MLIEGKHRSQQEAGNEREGELFYFSEDLLPRTCLVSMTSARLSHYQNAGPLHFDQCTSGTSVLNKGGEEEDNTQRDDL